MSIKQQRIINVLYAGAKKGAVVRQRPGAVFDRLRAAMTRSDY
ncbi:hypothetical protein HMPREF0758_4784 [Serratia odorifera DSM 4582]|uniref:Uncharacterized protein n=1 Tax=Serratia odorifera DSM 4582 TaxID=667129 RepID=D4E9D4_SEROD|nr:hypothetical protein HMPREF0758_4784 [Serratia odorifera DSM 4582]